MTNSNLINSLGLFLDIIGVILIWNFGLPDSISREGHTFITTEGSDEREKARAARYDRWSKIGLSLVIVGFVVQLVSNFITT